MRLIQLHDVFKGTERTVVRTWELDRTDPAIVSTAQRQYKVARRRNALAVCAPARATILMFGRPSVEFLLRRSPEI